MNIPEGFVLVPVDPIKAIDMGWAYLDAAREAEPSKSHSFSHAGYRAMIAAAPTVDIPVYDEAKERELFEALTEKECPGADLRRCGKEEESYMNFYVEERWIGWKSCAQSRARSAE